MVHTRAFYHNIRDMSSEEKTVWIINAIRIMEELDEKLKIYARKIIELGGNKDVEDERNSVHDEINMMSPGHSHSHSKSKRRKTIGVGGKTRRRGKKTL
jgi:hypothetical protein